MQDALRVSRRTPPDPSEGWRTSIDTLDWRLDVSNDNYSDQNISSELLPSRFYHSTIQASNLCCYSTVHRLANSRFLCYHLPMYPISSRIRLDASDDDGLLFSFRQFCLHLWAYKFIAGCLHLGVASLYDSEVADATAPQDRDCLYFPSRSLVSTSVVY